MTVLRDPDTAPRAQSGSNHQQIGLIAVAAAVLGVVLVTRQSGTTPSGSTGSTPSGGGPTPAPCSIADGTLVNDTSDNSHYIVSGGELRWIASAAAFTACGYNAGDFVNYSHAQVAACPQGAHVTGPPCPAGPMAPTPAPPTTGPTPSPVAAACQQNPGTLVRNSTSGAIYVVNSDQSLSWIASEALLTTYFSGEGYTNYSPASFTNCTFAANFNPPIPNFPAMSGADIVRLGISYILNGPYIAPAGINYANDVANAALAQLAKSDSASTYVAAFQASAEYHAARILNNESSAAQSANLQTIRDAGLTLTWAGSPPGWQVNW